MRILVLGGTLFLSHAVAAEAVVRGHEVTCAARGESGSVPQGARLVRLDRTAPDWSVLEGSFDAVVDVARTPSWVRTALEALAGRIPHWTFVSSISVYADMATPGGCPDRLSLLEPILEDVEQDSTETYGASKVGCEQLVVEHAEQAFLVRPGLIVGPGDPTGRFSYWPARLAAGGEVLAPEQPDVPTQAIDVRDVAAWIITGVEERLTGPYDVTSRVRSLGDVLAEVLAGVGGPAELTWVPADFLARHDVRPWAGPRSLPLWLPEERRGLVTHDVAAAFAAGLTTRPVAETARDTLEWLRTDPGAVRTGLSADEEREVLAAWHSIRA